MQSEKDLQAAESGKTDYQPEEMAVQALSRANVYEFLSRVYLQELSQEFIKAITDPAAAANFQEMGIDLAEDLSGNKVEEIQENLAIAYCSTFVNPEETYLFPVESVQREGSYLKKSALEVESFYQSCSLGLPEKATEMPDHLGIEFDFMVKLALEEAGFWEKGKTDSALKYRHLQIKFLKEHLLVWVPKFSRKVEKQATHPFYSNIARITREFMALEMEEISGESE